MPSNFLSLIIAGKVSNKLPTDKIIFEYLCSFKSIRCKPFDPVYNFDSCSEDKLLYKNLVSVLVTNPSNVFSLSQTDSTRSMTSLSLKSFLPAFIDGYKFTFSCIVFFITIATIRHASHWWRATHFSSKHEFQAVTIGIPETTIYK